MILPILFIELPLIGYIFNTYSLLISVTELNLEAVLEVLEYTEECKELVDELRKKIVLKLDNIYHHNGADTMETKIKQLKKFFKRTDLDGNGTIDKLEFRAMLRGLQLTYR